MNGPADPEWIRGAKRDREGRFLDLWGGPEDRRTAVHMLRWIRERGSLGSVSPVPAGGVPRATPRVVADRVGRSELNLTWVGHSTVLIQIGGFNLLTDPIWSPRPSPVSWAGPVRISAPGVLFGELPPLDAVLISHDHYDHLDEGTVRRLVQRFPRLQWLAPLGLEAWLRARGARSVTEMDWGRQVGLEASHGALDVACLPARHWSRRTPRGTNRHLWCSFAVSVRGGRAVYYGGDSGYCSIFEEIGMRFGPFDGVILPIGAYEPRWFMKPQHMNPEEAVRAYLDLGSCGVFMGVHWGTFPLTDEPVLEPVERVRAAWTAARLPERDLFVPAVGETRVIAGG